MKLTFKRNYPFLGYMPDYDSRDLHLEITITLPEQKIIRGKIWREYTISEKDALLIKYLKGITAEYSVIELLFNCETHPCRGKDNRHLHAYCQIHKSDMAKKNSSQIIFSMMEKLKKLTGSLLVGKISKIAELEKEYNAVNWLNYVFKEHKEAIFTMTRNYFDEFNLLLKK